MTFAHPSALGGDSFYPLGRPEQLVDLKAGEAKLDALMRERKTFRAGRVVVAAEQESNAVFRIVSGWCARVRHLADGRAQILALLLPGDLFGVKALYAECETDEIYAVSEVVAMSAGREPLQDAMARDRQLALRLEWQMIEDDRRIRNWVVALGCGSADERLALMLLDLRGRLALAGTIAADDTEFACPLTQKQMGDLLGLTAVHINRTVKRFREHGLARVSRDRIVLDDIAGLHNIAFPMLDVFEVRSPAFGSAASGRRAGGAVSRQSEALTA